MPRKSDLGRKSIREREIRERGQGPLFQHWSQGKQLNKGKQSVLIFWKTHLSFSFARSSVNKYHEGEDSGLHREKSKSKQGFNNSLLCSSEGGKQQKQTCRMYPSRGWERKAHRISACVTVITGTLSIIKVKYLVFLPAEVSFHRHCGRSFQMDEP